MPSAEILPHQAAQDGGGIRARIESGEVVVGLMVVDFFTPALPRVLARAGVDFAIYDMESTGLGFDRLENMVALSRAAGIEPLVRVPRMSSSDIGRCLDLGATGIMAPKIENLEDAKRFVAATRYPPMGARGSGYRAYPDGYVSPTSASAREASNVEVLTICQLESEEAISQADEIAALPGIDVLNVGANDLASEFGVASSDPRILELVARVTGLCAAHGKAFGGRLPVSPSAERHPQLESSHRLVLVDHDTAALFAHTRAGVDALRKELRS